MKQNNNFQMKPVCQLIIAGMVGITLSGCGGGGGTAEDGTLKNSAPIEETAPDITVLVDQNESETTTTDGDDSVEEPPVLIATVNPEDGATSVETDVVLTASFYEDVFAASFNSDSFTLSNTRNKNTMEGTAEFNALNNTASFTPASDLDLLTTYTATIGEEITDLMGNPLGNQSVSFTTRDGAWGTSSTLSDGITDASAPQITTDKNGNIMAVWSSRSNWVNTLWASYYKAADNSWSTPQLISSENVDAYSIDTEMDNSGNVWAVWRQKPSNSIYARRFIAATASWEETSDIDANGHSVHDEPQITVDTNGNAMAVFKGYGRPNSVYSNYYKAGSGWQGAQLLEDDNINYANEVQIAFDNNGNALAVWAQPVSGMHAVWSRYYNVLTDSWGEVSQAGNKSSSPAFELQVAFDNSGTATVVWNQWLDDKNNLYANRFSSAGGWGTVELIESDDFGNSYSPQFSIDALGDVVVVWQSLDDEGAEDIGQIRTVRYTSSNGWESSNTVRIDSDDTAMAEEPQVVIDANGNAMAVWKWYREDNTAGFSFSRYNHNGNWSAAQMLDEVEGNANNSSLAVRENGSVLAVWSRDDEFGGADRILFNRFE